MGRDACVERCPLRKNEEVSNTYVARAFDAKSSGNDWEYITDVNAHIRPHEWCYNKQRSRITHVDSKVSKSTYIYRESSDLSRVQRTNVRLEIEEGSACFQSGKIRRDQDLVLRLYVCRVWYITRERFTERDATRQTASFPRPPSEHCLPRILTSFLSGVQGEPVREKKKIPRVLQPRR